MTLLVTECKSVCVLLYIFRAIYIAIDYIEEIYSTHSKGYNIMGGKRLNFIIMVQNIYFRDYTRFSCTVCSGANIDECLSLRSDAFRSRIVS